MISGEKQVLAQGALDAWALGVVAFELLTRRQAFQMIVQGKDTVSERGILPPD
ncbi:MAG: hypothetical protein HC767_03955 [Akkermansiaceae bacterium]|nr:hypothetical protein [Akkermansiaceae bacterium]